MFTFAALFRKGLEKEKKTIFENIGKYQTNEKLV